MKENIFLIGFSGTGKTTIGKELARRLDYEYIDTDLQIEHYTGRSVQEIFATDGEATFRQIEAEVLEEICKGDFQIVATGGGVIISAENRAQITSSGYLVCLEARPETIYVRLLLADSAEGEKSVRPLLAGANPFEKIKELKASRQPYYAQADWTVHTDFMTPEEVATEISNALDIIRRRGTHARSSVSPGSRAQADSLYSANETPAEVPAGPATNGNNLWIKTRQGGYSVLFGPGLLGQMGTLLQEHLPESVGRKVFVISDEKVAAIYGDKLVTALQNAGYQTNLKTTPNGEIAKSLDQVAVLYDWLATNRAERKDLIVALGGGVTGDLAGFVAATWLRGVPFVQVPTTLLAMVDSSVGGKTGVNLKHGKNLVGSFYPPSLVVSDVTLLETLQERERRSGWGEVIKHAIIPGADSDEKGALTRLDNLEEYLPHLLAGHPEITSRILRESVAVKAGVVEVDEHETGLRMTLNYGHTYAHALETASDYTALLHGEAVAIGMIGVAQLAHKLGYCDTAFVNRQKEIIEKFGFKLKARFDPEKALASLSLDKKSEGNKVRWIIPRGVGQVEIRRDIPAEAVKEVLLDLLEN